MNHSKLTTATTADTAKSLSILLFSPWSLCTPWLIGFALKGKEQ